MNVSSDSQKRRRKNDIDAEKKKEKELLEKEKSDKRKNKDFIMVFRDNMSNLRWLMKESGIASSILSFIMEHMDNYNALVCSYDVFQEYFSVSKDTVRRAIKLLKEKSFINILKSGRSNIYVVNQDIAWSSWGNQKKYCKFAGNILISKSENDEMIKSGKYKVVENFSSVDSVKVLDNKKIKLIK
jgi:hypothetical protein